MRAAKRAAFLLLCITAAAGFAALGVWQLQRLAWKRDLIARVDARVHAAPVSPPPRSDWPTLDARATEYRRVRLEGEFLHEQTTLVDALTELGPGSWVLTPLVTNDGTVLVNRGFVPSDRRRNYERTEGIVTVVGLLRLTEPGGRWLRPNRPRDDAWYSRDVAAIAAARGLRDVAPYFVDAEAGAPASYPVGGLTVVQFRNMHLVYAVTWFVLAGLAAAGAWRVLRDG